MNQAIPSATHLALLSDPITQVAGPSAALAVARRDLPLNSTPARGRAHHRESRSQVQRDGVGLHPGTSRQRTLEAVAVGERTDVPQRSRKHILDHLPVEQGYRLFCRSTLEVRLQVTGKGTLSEVKTETVVMRSKTGTVRRIKTAASSRARHRPGSVSPQWHGGRALLDKDQGVEGRLQHPRGVGRCRYVGGRGIIDSLSAPAHRSHLLRLSEPRA